MRVKQLTIAARAICVLAIACVCMFGQISSSVVGTVMDPANATVAGADVTLKDQSTGAERTTKTSAEGLFRFVNINAGTFTITSKAPGFKTRIQKDVAVSSSETRDVGNLTLEIGNVSDQISVNADAPPIQLASSEKALTMDQVQIENVPLRGRDIFQFIGTLPGVIDLGAHDFRNAYSVQNMSMNGNTSMMNVTVDGLTAMDTGCGNCLVQGNPNMDAVAEVKVLSSNYQAEFGRNSGGTITLVTKSGTQSFHGSGWWTHRHEEFNSNTYFNNRSGVAKPKYRFNLDGWSFGGPVYIPGKLNTSKKKLFFFASQEYTQQFVSSSLKQNNMPTALERIGDFSRTVNTNNTLIVIKNPTTAVAFPGNVIPQSQIGQFDPTGVGAKVLGIFPQTNYNPSVGTADYLKFNYQELNGGQHPLRDDVARLDGYITSKLSGYIRLVNDKDITTDPFAGFTFTYSPQIHPVPAYNISGALTYTVSPTLVNEFNLGKSGSDWNYSYIDPSKLSRSLFGNPPKLFPVTYDDPANVQSLTIEHMFSFIPNVSFGSIPSSATSISLGRETPNPVHNWSIVDNVSKVAGKHNFKFGLYMEYDWKFQANGQNYAGSYNFGNDSNNAAFGTGNGYANALLGYYSVYTEQTKRMTNIVDYWNHEWYAQDNWRVSRRLTLDLGIRFYHQTPQVDEAGTWAIFDPTKYSASAAPRIYSPVLVNGLRLAQDPLTQATAPAAAIGAFVPGSGSYSNGMIALGKGQPAYQQTPVVVAAPRIGFAYDVFGDGKTAIRGGFGIFYNRVNGNSVYNMTGNPPNSYTATVYDSTINNLAIGGGGLIAPTTINYYGGTAQWDSVRNASFGVQHSIGWNTTIDASWVGDWGVNQPWTVNLNPIPLGANFAAVNADPTKKQTPTPQPLPTVFERSKYPGWGDINSRAWGGHTNYHALQSTLTHRYSRGLEFGVNYTWSKALGTTSFQPLVANNESWNYGPLSTDRRQVASINTVYDLPGLGKKLDSKFLGIFTDHWVSSSIITFSTGSPFTPGFSTSSTFDITGSSSLGARISVIGDARAPSAVPNTYFNTAAFGLATTLNAATGLPNTTTLGSAGVNILNGPAYTNYDVNLAKRIPVGSDVRRAFVLRLEGYNLFNHAEFSGLSTSVQFDKNTGLQLANQTFGQVNSARPARIMSGVLRFEF